MSDLARRVTGMSGSDLFNHDLDNRVHSAKDIKLCAQDRNSEEDLKYKSNILLFPSEVEKRRTKLKQNPYPKAFRNPVLDSIGFYDIKQEYNVN